MELVRRYLSQEIARLGNKLAFEFMEPTPFHAGFSLSMSRSEKPESGHRFQADTVRPRGHASVAFRRDVQPDTDPDDALDELNRIDVFLLDPVHGLALIPFRKLDDLAWYVFDHFSPEGVTGWRYHHDPIEECRALNLLDEVAVDGVVPQ